VAWWLGPAGGWARDGSRDGRTGGSARRRRRDRLDRTTPQRGRSHHLQLLLPLLALCRLLARHAGVLPEQAATGQRPAEGVSPFRGRILRVLLPPAGACLRQGSG